MGATGRASREASEGGAECFPVEGAREGRGEGGGEGGGRAGRQGTREGRVRSRGVSPDLLGRLEDDDRRAALLAGERKAPCVHVAARECLRQR